ncbi:MAG: RNA polymerase sigma-70 factor [Bacteroidia bacterium]|nr:RNA polymerase sigma-70 factor [Bacteroidia bacterium]
MMKKSVMTNDETAEIIRRLKKDDKSALDDLFGYYYPRLHHFSKSILKIENEIDDILQDVFVKIWLNRQKIGNAETFNAYIFTITKNGVLNLIRKNLSDHTFRDQLFHRSVAEEYQPENQLEFEEIKVGIDQIVAKLPEKRQQIFILSRTDGLSNKEISQQLNISEKTVEDHITHAIKQIKRSMKEMGILSILYFYLFL